jgi:hypothetical protein
MSDATSIHAFEPTVSNFPSPLPAVENTTDFPSSSSIQGVTELNVRDNGAAAGAVQLLDAEAATLASMFQNASRHQGEISGLMSSVQQVGNSWYPETRNELVEWIFDFSDRFTWKRATAHVAVRYVDRFMTRHSIPNTLWKLCAATCLKIASKCEEHRKTAPTVSEIVRLFRGEHQPETVKEMELKVLDALQWDTVHVSPLHFLQFEIKVLRRLARSPSNRSQIHSSVELHAAPIPKLMKIESSTDSILESRKVESVSDTKKMQGEEQDEEKTKEGEVSEQNSQVWDPIEYVEEVGERAAAALDILLHYTDYCSEYSPQHLSAAAMIAARNSLRRGATRPYVYESVTGVADADVISLAASLSNIPEFTAIDCTVGDNLRCDEVLSDA